MNRKNFQAVALVITLFTWLVGCATQTDPNAIKLAVDQSNDAAQRQYQVSPFTRDSGKLWKAGNHWVWDAKVSSDGHTYVSRVSFDRNGGPATVDVHRQN